MATLYAYSPNGTQATLPVSIQGFKQSLASKGYTTLPNGLLFQWFRDGSTTITFPIAFSSSVYSATVAFYNDSYGSTFGSGYLGYAIPSLSSMTTYFGNVYDGTKSWCVIGK